RIRHEKNKDNHRRKCTHSLATVTLFEKFRHGFEFQAAGHIPRFSCKQKPRKKRTEHSVADSGKNAPKPEAQTRFPRVTDKHYRRKISRSVRQRRKPRAGVTPADGKIGNVFGFLTG